MKNFTNVKIKTFFAIFFSINLILQPFCIYFYIINKIEAGNILQHVIAGLYLSLCFSALLNEYIFKTIFYRMLKGKIITGGSSTQLLIIYYIMFIVLFFLWILFFVVKNYYVTYPLTFIVVIGILELNQTYIICNGFLFCGFTVVPIDTIKWYHVYKKRRPVTMIIKYQGNKSFKTSNNIKCINELKKYLETHNVKEKIS